MRKAKKDFENGNVITLESSEVWQKVAEIEKKLRYKNINAEKHTHNTQIVSYSVLNNNR